MSKSKFQIRILPLLHKQEDDEEEKKKRLNH